MKIIKRTIIAGLTLLSLALIASGASAQREDSFMEETKRRYESDTNRKQYEELYNQARKVKATKPADAEALLRKALTLKSEFIVPMYAQQELATLYLSQRKYRAAIKVYDALFEKGLKWGGSEEPKILADYADALMGAGEIERAVTALNVAIKSLSGPDYNGPVIPGFVEDGVPAVAEVRATIYLVRGVYHIGVYKLGEAGSELLKSTKSAPRLDLSHYYLGQYYEILHRVPEAVSEYQKAIRYSRGEIRDLAEKQIKSIAPASKP